MHEDVLLWNLVLPSHSPFPFEPLSSSEASLRLMSRTMSFPGDHLSVYFKGPTFSQFNKNETDAYLALCEHFFDCNCEEGLCKCNVMDWTSKYLCDIHFVFMQSLSSSLLSFLSLDGFALSPDRDRESDLIRMGLLDCPGV